MNKFYEFIGTGFYTGYLPAAPGSWASWLAGCIFWLIIEFFAVDELWLSLLGGSFLFLVGLPISNHIAHKSKKSDPGFIVIDEWSGMFFTFCLVTINIYTFLLGFIIFRFFDIAKPWPISALEKLPSGWGIMLDDVIAGYFSALILFLSVHLSQYLST